MRDERKKEIEEHVQSVTAILKEVERAGYIDEEENISGDGDEKGGEWGGFEDVPAANTETLDHEEEYIDEDRFTTVTVESVSVSRDGLIKPEDEEEGEDDQAEEKAKNDAESTSTSKDTTRKHKNKKQKFRYETKTERLQEQRRQKARKKRKAGAAA